jgi:Tfp pilus assembly protein PilV
MKVSRKIQKRLTQRSADKETGLSLVETLIAIALFAVIAVMAISIISTTMNSTTRFSSVSTTQTEVAQASAIIQRDISLARSITVASAYQVSFTTKQDNLDYKTTLFYYNPATSTAIPAGIDPNQLPNYAAIIQLRTAVTSGKNSQTIIVKGYDPAAYPGGSNSLFSYFDAANDEITPANLNTQNKRDGITRVGFRIAAKAAGRGSYIQIESSATPAAYLPQGVNVQDINSGPPICPANLDANITAQETKSTLNWNAPAGSTSYTLYRYNMSAGNVLEKSYVVANPDVTNYVDSGLEWGNTYRYSIQSNGPQGSSNLCGGVDVTVVPDVNRFVNLNTLQQSLTATKSGTGTETLAAPNVSNVPTNTKVTTQIESGNRYTVARNQTNQISWDQSFGTAGFRVYAAPYNAATSTPLVTISSGTLYWQDRANFGDIKSYVVTSFNAGGESKPSASVTLTSPPKASTFVQPKGYNTPEQLNAANSGVDEVRPDTSTRSTTTDNNLIVKTRAPNTVGFKTYKRSEIAATADCALVGSSPVLNFAGSNTTDSNAEWGSVSCYQFVPFNDAGDGEASDPLEVKQFPGNFNMATFESSPYRHINTGVALPSGTQCWVSSPNGRTDTPCIDGSGMTSDNRFALGLFGTVENLQTTLTTSWNESKNAYGDYTINKVRTESGGIQDQGSQRSSNTAPYVVGSQSSRFVNEMPGSVFTVNVVSKSLAGLSRTSDTKESVVTVPDIPKAMDLNFQSRSELTYPDDYYRIKVLVDTGIVRGLASSVVANASSATGMNTGTFAPNSGVQATYTPQYATGYHAENTYSVLFRNGVSAFSNGIGRSGFVTPGCSTPCGSSFGDTPEKYPNYYAGGHYRYNAGGTATEGVDGGTNGPAKPPALPPTAPAMPVGSGVPDGQTYNCSIISEDHPLYTSEYGCAYGDGIPRTPTTLRVASINTTSVALAWTASPYASGYVISSTVNGATTKTTVATNSGTITVPAGTTATITVSAYNSAASSPQSAVLTVRIPAVPTGIKLVSVAGNTANIAWNAAANATSYQLTMVSNGVTTTGTTTTLAYAVPLTPGYATVVTIKAINGAATSAASAAFTINGPGAPTGLSLVSLSGGTANITWTAVANAASYSIITVVSGVTTTYSNVDTTFSLPVTAGKDISVTVKAVNAAGTSPASTALLIESPGIPTGLKVVSSSGTTVTVGWTAVTNATSYRVNRVVNGVTTTYTTGAVQLALTIPFDTDSSFTVQAVTAAGGISTASAPFSLDTQVSTPPAATNLRVTDNTTGDSVTIAWNAVTCASGTPNYQFDWVSKTGTSAWSTTPSYTTTSVIEGKTEQWRVIASCLSGSTRSASSTSAPASFTPKVQTPGAPGYAPTPNQTSPYLVNSNVTFSFNTGVCGTMKPTYLLYLNGVYVRSGTSTVADNVGSTAQTLSYTYRVACYNATYDYTTPSSPMSPATSVAVVTAPAKPSNFQVTRIYGATVTFSWTGVAAGTSYELDFNGSTKTINSTSNSTITTTKVGKIRNQAFNNAVGTSQPAPEAFPVAKLTTIDANGYSSTTDSTTSVDMPRMRIFTRERQGFVPQPNTAGVDSRADSALVSADGLRMTVLRTDRKMVTYNLSDNSVLWSSNNQGGIPYVDHWVLETNGEHAMYANPSSWTKVWNGWQNLDMMVQENATTGSATGRINGLKYSGGWQFVAAHQ